MSKTLLRISGIITLIVGIIYSLTIVLLIIGIPTIVGAVKLLNYAEMEDNELEQNKNTILIWGIVLIFLSFIAGVLTLIAYTQIKPQEKVEPKVDVKQPEQTIKKNSSPSTKTAKKSTTTKKSSTTKTSSKTSTNKKTNSSKTNSSTTKKTTPKK